MLTVSRPHWVCRRSWCLCFPCLHFLGSRLLCQELSEVSPGLYALPRSKLLRFRYSDSPQRRRLGWACVLCPSQIQEAQVTRCLASTVAATYCLPCPCRSVFGCTNGAPSQADADRPESQEKGFSRGSYPTVWFAIPSKLISLRLPSGHSGLLSQATLFPSDCPRGIQARSLL